MTGSWKRALGLIVVLMLLLLLIGSNWIGYRAFADDIMSIRGALLWQEQFPYLGATHWELRHPYILFMSATTALGGLNDFTVTLPSVLAAMASCVLCLYLAPYVSPAASPVLAGTLFALTPITVISSTTLVPGSVELMLVLASLLSFFIALRNHATARSPVPMLVGSGLLAGLAFINRETSIALVGTYAILFLVGYALPRKRYMWLFLAASIPLVADLSYVYVSSGDPAYKIRVDIEQKHSWSEIDQFDFLNPTSDGAQGQLTVPYGGSNRSAPPPLGSSLNDQDDRQTSPEHIGPVDLGRTINSLAAFWVNHEYGVSFHFLVALLATCAFLKVRVKPGPEMCALLLLALVWFVTQAFVIGMRPHPRYYQPVAFAFMMLNVHLLTQLWKANHTLLVVLATLGLISINLLALGLHNDRMVYERFVAQQTEAYSEGRIFVPTAQHANRARFFVQTRNTDATVLVGCPEKIGDMLIASTELSDSIRRCGHEYDLRQSLTKQSPSLLGSALLATGMDRFVPAGVRSRIIFPVPDISTYVLVSE